MTFQKLRDDLPVTRNVDYFQVGSHGPTPDSVLDVVREEMALEAHYHSVPSVKAEQAGREAAARARVASFIGAGADEVALTPNTTQAMRLVSRSIDWNDGDELLITSLEHVSTVTLGWGLGRTAGVRLRVVEADQGDALFLESLKSAITDRTRLLCVSHVASPDGQNPPGRRRRRAGPRARRAGRRRHGAVAGTVPGGRPFSRLRLHGGLRAQVAARADGRRHPVGLPRQPRRLHARPAARPQAVEHTGVPGAGPDRVRPRRGRDSQHGDGDRARQGGARLIDELGTDAIAARVAGLSRTLRDGASRIGGVDVLTPTQPGRSAGITTLTFDGHSAEDLQQLVARIYERHNVLVKFQWLTAPMDPERTGMRISVASFNDEEEIGRLLDALRDEVGRDGVR